MSDIIFRENDPSGQLLAIFARALGLAPGVLPFALRGYQQKSVSAWLKDLAEGHVPVGGAPTGSGKSWIIAGLLYVCLKACPGFKAIILARDEQLVKQNCETFLQVAPEFAHLTGIFCAGLNQKDVHASIIFATAQSVFNFLDLVTYDHLLVVDECDQVGFGDDTKQYNAIFARAGALCGLSATLYRLHKGRTVSIVGGQTMTSLCFNKISFDLSQKMLAELNYYCLTVNAGALLGGIDGMDRSVMRVVGGEFDCELQAINPMMIRRVFAAFYKALETIDCPHEPAMIYASSRKHARLLKTYFVASDYKAATVFANGADKNAVPRKQTIDDFKARKIQVLIVVGCLNRGFDFPAIRLVIVAFATKSRARWTQACGRGSRPLEFSPWGPPKKVFNHVLDFGNNFEAFGTTDMTSHEAIELDAKPPPGIWAGGSGGATGERQHFLSATPSSLPAGANTFTGLLVKCSPVIRVKKPQNGGRPKLLADTSFHIAGLKIHREIFHIGYRGWPEAQLRCLDLLIALRPKDFREFGSLNDLSAYKWARIIEEGSLGVDPLPIELRRFPDYRGEAVWQVISIDGFVLHNTSLETPDNPCPALYDPGIVFTDFSTLEICFETRVEPSSPIPISAGIEGARDGSAHG